MGNTKYFVGFSVLLSGCHFAPPPPPPPLAPLASAAEITQIEIATQDWARTLKKQGKDWFVFQDAQLLGPAKASLALRAIEILIRDRSRLPTVPSSIACPTVLLLKSPNLGLTVCKSDRDFYVNSNSTRTPAVRDGTSVLVGALTSPSALLDPRLVSWDADRVKQIEVRSNGKTTLFERNGVLWTSPVAREILKATVTETSGHMHRGEIELTIRGLNEDPLVIRGNGSTFTVSNRPGVYQSTVSAAAIARSMRLRSPISSHP